MIFPSPKGPTLALLLVTLAACGGGSGTPPPSASGQPSSTAAGPSPTASAPQDGEALPDVASPYDALPPEARGLLDRPFTGDLDQMVKRRVIRAGVTFNRTHYFIDKGEQRGAAYESLLNFEEALNARLKTGLLRVHVAVVPLPRDMLIPALTEGKVDLVAAQLTVTPERQKLVDFSNPTRSNVSEIVVTGPGSAAVSSPDDLSGREVFVRTSSSYHDSLLALNERLKAAGRPPALIKPAPENLEDDDILEMVNAGLVPATVVDDYLAQFWKQVFPNLALHPVAALRTGGALAVAMRKDNPKLKEAANLWLQKYGERTAFGNVAAEAIPREHEVREERRGRGGTAQVQRDARFLPQVRRAVSGRSDIDGRARLPGVGAEPEREEPRRRHRRDAADARDRQGAEGRRHHPGRAEHPRRGQVHAVHDGPVPTKTNR